MSLFNQFYTGSVENWTRNSFTAAVQVGQCTKIAIFLDGRSIAILTRCPTLNSCRKAIAGLIFNKVSAFRLRTGLSNGVLLLKIKRKVTDRELHSSKRHRSLVIDLTGRMVKGHKKKKSLRFSLQLRYRCKEGSNPGIILKFEVDPSTRSRVRAIWSWKVERKSGHTLEICAWHNRGAHQPGTKSGCTFSLHATQLFRPLRFSLSFLFCFSKCFYVCTKLKSNH